MQGPTLQVDAFPWGGGMVLVIGGLPVEYGMTEWQPRDAARLATTIGAPDGQTTWEYVVILLGLIVWGAEHRATGLAVLGDNLAALEGALGMKGRGVLTKVTREIAWRLVRFAWRFAAGHLPSEHNHYADALSRVCAPEGADKKQFPVQLLGATRRDVPELRDVWACE